MTTSEYNKAALTGEIKDSENPIFIFSQTSVELLCAIAKGEIDAVEFAKHELKSRGLNENGMWVGLKG